MTITSRALAIVAAIALVLFVAAGVLITTHLTTKDSGKPPCRLEELTKKGVHCNK